MTKERMSHKTKAAPKVTKTKTTAGIQQQQQQVVNPIVLPRKIGDYSAIADFLAGCKSPFTAKGYKTALNKFFNFAAVENKGFDPDVAITMRPEELNPIVLKYAMHLKKVAKKTTDGYDVQLPGATVIGQSWRVIEHYHDQRRAKL